jgi:glycosyltransferase involved in cell wall biosynthesis
MNALPGLLRSVPDLIYMIAGDGSDRARLETKARELGIADRVIFTGFICEHEKVDHYRLARAFALPGWGEGFGIVLLEAMACGVPVLGSTLDGTRDALLDGALGLLVNPHDHADLERGILETLRRPLGIVPAGLSYFSLARFQDRLAAIIKIIQGPPIPLPVATQDSL